MKTVFKICSIRISMYLMRSWININSSLGKSRKCRECKQIAANVTLFLMSHSSIARRDMFNAMNTFKKEFYGLHD